MADSRNVNSQRVLETRVRLKEMIAFQKHFMHYSLMNVPRRLFGCILLSIISIVQFGFADSPTPTDSSPTPPPVIELQGLDHVGLNVADLQRSAAFYNRVLGFQIFHKWTTTWMIQRGSIRIGLFQRPQAQTIKDIDNTIAITHFAFLTSGMGFAAAQKELTALGVNFDPPEDTGVAFSIFFRDPDGHQIEITTYHSPNNDIKTTR